MRPRGGGDALVAARRLRGELRRLAHPAVGVALAGAAATCVVAQRSAPLAVGHGPSPGDLSGALRIALQHHASGVGVALLAVATSVTTASDARTGATGAALLAGPTVCRLWAQRIVALLVIVGWSVVQSAALVRVTAGATACRTACPRSARSVAGAAVIDAAVAALAALTVAALLTLLALIVRNELLVIVVALVAYFAPANHLGDPGAWVTPTKWIATVMQFEPEGLGSDYTGGMSSARSRGLPALIAGGLLVAATATAGWAGSALLRRRGGEGEVG